MMTTLADLRYEKKIIFYRHQVNFYTSLNIFSIREIIKQMNNLRNLFQMNLSKICCRTDFLYFQQ